MSQWTRAKRMFLVTFALSMAAGFLTGRADAQGTAPFPAPPPGSPAGAMAYSCGVPATPLEPGARPQQATFPAGQYPVSLPATSLLGARNDLPNPFGPGVDWGELPAGRKWGSTASITTAPDGTIWVIDRCGNSGAGGTTCGGDSASVNPIFQFEPSGKLLKTFGAGMFVSPHKLTVDDAGNLWVADNGSHQVFKMDQNGRVLMTLGKKGVAGPGTDELDAPTEVAIAPNGDIFVADGHTGGGLAVGNARIMRFDRTGKFLKTWGKKGMGPGGSTCRTRWPSIHAGGCSSATARTTAFRSSTRKASSSRNGSSSAARAGSTSTARPTRSTSPIPNRVMAAPTQGALRWRKPATASTRASGAASASAARAMDRCAP